MWTSEVMLMSLKMKSKHLVPNASAPILVFFFFFFLQTIQFSEVVF